MTLWSQLKADFQFYREIMPYQGRIAVLLDRRFWVCANYRIGYRACQARTPILGAVWRFFYVILNQFISIVTGTVIRSGAVIGQRFNVHTLNAILVTNEVVMGDDCTITTGVCIANKANNRNEGTPRIGNQVTFGLGCKVLGGITIGDNVIVGANAVVLHDVPSNHIAVGVPARNKPINRSSNGLSANNEGSDYSGELVEVEVRSGADTQEAITERSLQSSPSNSKG